MLGYGALASCAGPCDAAASAASSAKPPKAIVMRFLRFISFSRGSLRSSERQGGMKYQLVSQPALGLGGALSSEDVQYVDINITKVCQIAPRSLITQRCWFATVASVFMCNARHGRWPGVLMKHCDRSTSRMASS